MDMEEGLTPLLDTLLLDSGLTPLLNTPPLDSRFHGNDDVKVLTF